MTSPAHRRARNETGDAPPASATNWRSPWPPVAASDVDPRREPTVLASGSDATGEPAAAPPRGANELVEIELDSQTQNSVEPTSAAATERLGLGADANSVPARTPLWLAGSATALRALAVPLRSGQSTAPASRERAPDLPTAIAPDPEPEPGDVAAPPGCAAERTLDLLANYPHPEEVAAVAAAGLEEPELQERVLDLLLALPTPRAAREVIRRYHGLPESLRRQAMSRDPSRLSHAAELLLGSDRAQTRLNVVEFAATALAHEPQQLTQYLPWLLQLMDDPVDRVRERARGTLLDGLRHEHNVGRFGQRPRDRALQGLMLLLERFERHQDLDVIRALFEIGDHGADLLGRAVGERRPAASAIARVASEETANERDLDCRLAALFRWLRSPFPAAREEARRLLRERSDAPFLSCCVRRLLAEGQVGADHPTFKHLRWDLTPPTVLSELPASTMNRIAGYLNNPSVEPADRAQRLARLLPACSPASLKEVLGRLRELPTEGILEAIEAVTLRADADEEVQRLATELVTLKAGGRAYTLLVRLLQSPFESVRALAQRRLSGHGLEFYFESQAQLSPEARKQSIAILRRVDLHFFGQLRRALRAPEEDRVVRALGAVLDLDQVSPIEDGLFDLTVNPSPRVRATLAQALARTSGDARHHYLRLLLADSDPRVTANSVEALAKIEGPRAATWLGPLRRNRNPRVRCNALLALGRLGDASARAELLELAAPATASSGLRASAGWALGQLAAAS